MGTTRRHGTAVAIVILLLLSVSSRAPGHDASIAAEGWAPKHRWQALDLAVPFAAGGIGYGVFPDAGPRLIQTGMTAGMIAGWNPLPSRPGPLPGSFSLGLLDRAPELPGHANAAGGRHGLRSAPAPAAAALGALSASEAWAMILLGIGLACMRLRRKSRLAGARHFT